MDMEVQSNLDTKPSACVSVKLHAMHASEVCLAWLDVISWYVLIV